MAKKLFRYFTIAAVCILIILMITNPSVKQFKEYIGNPTFKDFTLSYKRTSNWLIYSTYEFSYILSNDDYDNYDNNELIKSKLNQLTGTYKGYFLNFYRR